jgi:hypothetical protein
MAAAPTDRVRVGCSGLPPGMRRQTYFAKLGFLEASEMLGNLPKPNVLRRWRREAPAPAGYSLLVHDDDPPAPSLIARDAEGLALLVEAAAILEVDTVVFRTSPRITPSADHRDRLRRFFREVASAERFATATRVWEPQGLWEPEVAARLCAELDLVYSCDPLSSDPLAPDLDFFAALPGNRAYFRITGLGRANRLDDLQLDKLLALTAAYGRSWVLFGGGGSLKSALALQQRCQAVC